MSVNHSFKSGCLRCVGLLLLTFPLFCTPQLAAQSSPYINRVWDYLPAPGQFVNTLPAYEKGNTASDMRFAAQESIAEDAQIMISLGAWGGYVVFGFDHMVENKQGMLDFAVYGNSFAAAANPNPDAPPAGGSSEPAIVMVSYDDNGNGRPDDRWYELAGSEYYKPETRHNYTITYYRPAADHIATPNNDYKYLTDTTYIFWRDSRGETGYVSKNSFHRQDYFPIWIDADSLSFTGTRLQDNYRDESGTGTYYVQYPYDYGYADNRPNNDPASKFNIAWAVDSLGDPVSLPGIHFVKVYTGVQQYCGWLGETSTEILAAYDLHLTGEAETDTFNPNPEKPEGWVIDSDADSEAVQDAITSISDSNAQLLNTIVHDCIYIYSPMSEPVQVLDQTGQLMFSANTNQGMFAMPCPSLSQGIYILRIGTHTVKFLKL